MGGNSSKEIKDIELYKSQFRISEITDDAIFKNFTLLKEKSSNNSLVLKEVVCKD
jgi:hypothetical protein